MSNCKVIFCCRFEIDEETVKWLSEICDGDARIGLNSLQMAVKLKTSDTSSAQITLDDIKDGIKVHSYILSTQSTKFKSSAFFFQWVHSEIGGGGECYFKIQCFKRYLFT